MTKSKMISGIFLACCLGNSVFGAVVRYDFSEALPSSIGQFDFINFRARGFVVYTEDDRNSTVFDVETMFFDDSTDLDARDNALLKLSGSKVVSRCPGDCWDLRSENAAFGKKIIIDRSLLPRLSINIPKGRKDGHLIDHTSGRQWKVTRTDAK